MLAGDAERTARVATGRRWPTRPREGLVTAIVEADATGEAARRSSTLQAAAEGAGCEGRRRAPRREMTDDDGNWIDPESSAGDAAVAAVPRGEDPAEDAAADGRRRAAGRVRPPARYLDHERRATGATRCLLSTGIRVWVAVGSGPPAVMHLQERLWTATTSDVSSSTHRPRSGTPDVPVTSRHPRASQSSSAPTLDSHRRPDPRPGRRLGRRVGRGRPRPDRRPPRACSSPATASPARSCSARPGSARRSQIIADRLADPRRRRRRTDHRRPRSVVDHRRRRPGSRHRLPAAARRRQLVDDRRLVAGRRPAGRRDREAVHRADHLADPAPVPET